MRAPVQQPVILLRREDMAFLRLEFGNVSIAEDGQGTRFLVVTDPEEESFLSVGLPPQALLEQALAQVEAVSLPLGARFSGPSTLRFAIGSGLPCRYTAERLLAMIRECPMVDTSLEVVWDLRFVLAGEMSKCAWDHVAEPVRGSKGTIDLWHTDLTTRNQTSGLPDARPAAPMLLPKAITSGLTNAFTGSLSGPQRRSIVTAINSKPMTARSLSLSALGATIDLVGEWPSGSTTIAAYSHRAHRGRDTDVSITERGFLFPVGFAVHLTTTTERRLEAGEALLRQKELLAVQTPLLCLDKAVGLPQRGRAFPLREVRLDGPLEAEVSTAQAMAAGASWINLPSGERLLFRITAKDYAGNTVSFSLPMAFVNLNHAFGDLTAAITAYDNERQALPIPTGARVALAKEAPGETVADVVALYIGACKPEALPPDTFRAAGRLAAFPRLAQVDARIPALEAFSAAGNVPGAAVASAVRQPAQLILEKAYLESGINATNVYAKLVKQVAFEPPVTNAGGLARLGVPVSGLSRRAGLVGGDIETFKQGNFDPAQFFKKDQLLNLLPPKLLGFVSLAEIVDKASLSTDGEAVPKVVTEVRFPSGDHTRPPESVHSTVTWRPKLKADLYGILRVTAATSLELRSTNVVDLGGRAPTSNVRGDLRSFSLEFANVLVIDFGRLSFTSESGSPPALGVKVADVRFSKDLRFLDKLRKYLPSPANGPRIAVTRSGIEAGYTLGIPDVALGVFLLQNLALSATVILPLGEGSVTVKFQVSSREHPFLVTVSAFGGGGFVALTFEGSQVKELEAQLSFGAACALNLGIASASVMVTANINIRYREGSSRLEGFLRAVGELDVLGLVNISVELMLSIRYQSETVQKAVAGTVERRYAVGCAVVVVRVRVLFFSESITLSVERRFGDGSDPTFDIAFPTPRAWHDRCNAYAKMVSP
jgi:hypothetical protein